MVCRTAVQLAHAYSVLDNGRSTQFPLARVDRATGLFRNIPESIATPFRGFTGDRGAWCASCHGSVITWQAERYRAQASVNRRITARLSRVACGFGPVSDPMHRRRHCD
jgi:hypothetical protein